jgi:hypothetical protein
MKSKTGKTLFAAAAWLALAPAAAHAAGPFYFGAKGGFVDVDGRGYDGAFNVGVVGGYTFLENRNGSFAAEGELTLSLVDGDIAGGGEWDITTLGVFAVYRTPQDVYFKGKAGIMRSDVDTTVGNASVRGSDTELAVGVGLGFKLGRTAHLEIEYTLSEVKNADVDFLSVSFHLPF